MHAKFLLPFLVAGVLAMPRPSPEGPAVAQGHEASHLEARSGRPPPPPPGFRSSGPPSDYGGPGPGGFPPGPPSSYGRPGPGSFAPGPASSFGGFGPGPGSRYIGEPIQRASDGHFYPGHNPPPGKRYVPRPRPTRQWPGSEEPSLWNKAASMGKKLLNGRDLGSNSNAPSRKACAPPSHPQQRHSKRDVGDGPEALNHLEARGNKDWQRYGRPPPRSEDFSGSFPPSPPDRSGYHKRDLNQEPAETPQKFKRSNRQPANAPKPPPTMEELNSRFFVGRPEIMMGHQVEDEKSKSAEQKTRQDIPPCQNQPSYSIGGLETPPDSSSPKSKRSSRQPANAPNQSPTAKEPQDTYYVGRPQGLSDQATDKKPESTGQDTPYKNQPTYFVGRPEFLHDSPSTKSKRSNDKPAYPYVAPDKPEHPSKYKKPDVPAPQQPWEKDSEQLYVGHPAGWNGNAEPFGNVYHVKDGRVEKTEPYRPSDPKSKSKSKSKWWAL
ncbi:hypothetical protein OOU_Y34scaffold00365g2 [Pyricularia oryzae Y34]|nr:hypothetical protein OOU_Y34scaffold00365g2 [Pyricularia oryzae Y34]